MGRISSNKMPGEGKSGYWRRERCSLTSRPASSEEPVAEVEGSCLWGASVASGRFGGGCCEVDCCILERE